MSIVQMKRVDIGQPFPDLSGKVGATVRLNLADGGWNGHYRFETHGMTDDEILAKIAAVTQRHQARAARMNGFAAINRDLVVSGSAFRLVDLTIADQGTDVVLRFALEDANGVRVAEIKRTFRAVADVPVDGVIVIAAIAAAKDYLDAQTAMTSRRSSLASLVAPIVAVPVTGPIVDPINGGGL